jgi:hypothetical protein
MNNPRRSALAWEHLLSFAAVPSFVAMGFFTAFDGHYVSGAICTVSSGGPHVTQMVAMYALMSVLHLKPWLRLYICWRR